MNMFIPQWLYLQPAARRGAPPLGSFRRAGPPARGPGRSGVSRTRAVRAGLPRDPTLQRLRRKMDALALVTRRAQKEVRPAPRGMRAAPCDRVWPRRCLDRSFRVLRSVHLC